MNINDFRLSYLKNCNSKERMNEWIRSGGTLRNNRTIGCGINSLTFLGVFTRQEGESYVDRICSSGTPFVEMMRYVKKYNNNNIDYQEVIFDISTDQLKVDFLNKLTDILPNNSCTVAKLNRLRDISKRPVPCQNFTKGHSIVFSKENEELFTIDPQINFIKKRDDSKLIPSWNKNCYISVSLIFQKKIVIKKNTKTHPFIVGHVHKSRKRSHSVSTSHVHKSRKRSHSVSTSHVHKSRKHSPMDVVSSLSGSPMNIVSSLSGSPMDVVSSSLGSPMDVVSSLSPNKKRQTR